MIAISGTILEFRVEMLLGETQQERVLQGNHLKIEVQMGDRWVVQLDTHFGSQRVMGEYLSDYLGARVASDFLTQHKVPRELPIWKLNQKG